MIVYYDGEKAEIFFVESLEIEWSDEEIEYSKLWKTFHKTISIKERENKKQQKGQLSPFLLNIKSFIKILDIFFFTQCFNPVFCCILRLRVY